MIQVTDKVFKELSQNPDTKKYDPATKQMLDYVAPFSFARAILSKRGEVVAQSRLALNTITKAYTRDEIDSWPTQESEARAWTADNTASTPLIDFLVANRPSVDKATLVGRILTNAQNYKEVSGSVIGKLQAFNDQLDALQTQHDDPGQPDVTQSDIDEIIVDYS